MGADTLRSQDAQALYVHRNVVDMLPGVLRAYVGWATAVFGDLAQADLVKIRKASGKVTFLVYDDFEGKPLPELQHRIKVNVKTRWVQAFDHRGSGQLLYFKERFLAPVSILRFRPRPSAEPDRHSHSLVPMFLSRTPGARVGRGGEDFRYELGHPRHPRHPRFSTISMSVAIRESQI